MVIISIAASMASYFYDVNTNSDTGHNTILSDVCYLTNAMFKIGFARWV